MIFPRVLLLVMRVSVGSKHQKRVIFISKIYYDLPRYQYGTYITKLYVLYSSKTHKEQIIFVNSFNCTSFLLYILVIIGVASITVMRQDAIIVTTQR